MRKLIFILCITLLFVATMYAQDDSVFVFVDYRGTEAEYFFSSTDAAHEFLAETYDTTHASCKIEYVLLTEYHTKIGIPLKSENFTQPSGKNKNKVFMIKSEHGKKLKKAKKAKKDKEDKP